MESSEQALRCCCPNGHKIRASQKHAGRTIACPACGSPVSIPQPDASITDTGAVRILNDLESEFREARKQEAPKAAASSAKPAKKPEKSCPRCNGTISKRDHVCPECKLILESGNRVFQKIYKAALRSLN